MYGLRYLRLEAGVLRAERNSTFLVVARRAFSTLDADAPKVRLYQYAICPFCNRSKALLRFSGTKYDAVEVNPLTKREVKWYEERV